MKRIILFAFFLLALQTYNVVTAQVIDGGADAVLFSNSDTLYDLTDSFAIPEISPIMPVTISEDLNGKIS
jgi:hypothetical protein